MKLLKQQLQMVNQSIKNKWKNDLMNLQLINLWLPCVMSTHFNPPAKTKECMADAEDSMGGIGCPADLNQAGGRSRDRSLDNHNPLSSR